MQKHFFRKNYEIENCLKKNLAKPKYKDSGEMCFSKLLLNESELINLEEIKDGTKCD